MLATAAEALTHPRSAQWLQMEHVLELVDNLDILGAIFGSAEIHKELATRTVPLIRLLVKQKAFTKDMLNPLIRAATSASLSNSEAAVEVLGAIAQVWPLDFVMHILDSAFAVPPEEVTPQLLQLIMRMGSITLHGAQPGQQAIQVLLRLLSDKADVEAELRDAAAQNVQALVKLASLEKERGPTAERCVAMLQEHDAVPRVLDTLWSIVDSYYLAAAASSSQQSKAQVAAKLNEEHSLLSLLLSDLQLYKQRAGEKLASQGSDASAGGVAGRILVGSDTHIRNITSRLSFIVNLLTKCGITITSDQIRTMWEAAYVTAFCDEERAAAVKAGFDMTVKQSSSSRVFRPGAPELLLETMCGTATARQSLTVPEFDLCKQLFILINCRAGVLSPLTTEKFEMRQSPSDVLEANTMWGVLFDAANKDVSDKAGRLIVALYNDLNVEMRQHSEGALRRELLHKCKDLLSTATQEKKEQQAARLLAMLERLLIRSDRLGHGGLLPHGRPTRGYTIKLTFSNNVTTTPEAKALGRSFSIDATSNMTVWDMREVVGTKLGLPAASVRLIRRGAQLTDSDNMNLLADFKVHAKESWLATQAPAATVSDLPLLVDRSVTNAREGQLIPAAVDAYTEIFNSYTSSTGVMTKKDLRDYFVACGAPAHSLGETRINGIFAAAETDADGDMTLGGFLLFYTEAAITREYSAWKDLKTHGYTPLLKKRQPTAEAKEALLKTGRVPAGASSFEPMAEVTVDTLPEDTTRAILAHDDSFFNVLFEALNLSEAISNAAWQLIQTLPTQSSHAALIHDLLDSEEAGQTQEWWQRLFPSASPFRVLYSLQIIQRVLDAASPPPVAPAAEATSAGAGKESKEETKTDTATDAAADTKSSDGTDNESEADEGNGGGDKAEPETTEASGEQGADVAEADAERLPGQELSRADAQRWQQLLVERGGWAYLTKLLLQQDVEPVSLEAAATLQAQGQDSDSSTGGSSGLKRQSLATLLTVMQAYLLPAVAISTGTSPVAADEDGSALLSESQAEVAPPVDEDDGEVDLVAFITGASIGPAPRPSGHKSASDRAEDAEADAAAAAAAQASVGSMKMDDATARKVLEVLDLAAVFTKLVELTWAAAIRGSDADAALAVSALQLFKGLMQSDASLTRRWLRLDLQRVRFVDHVRAMLLCPTQESIRQATASTLLALCNTPSDPASNAIPVSDMVLEALLQMRPTASDNALTAQLPRLAEGQGTEMRTSESETRSSPRCFAFFNVLNALLKPAIKDNGVSRFQPLMQSILKDLSEHTPMETRDPKSPRDYLLAGNLQVLAQFVRADPTALMTEAKTAGMNLVSFLYTCLFQLPATSAELDESSTPAPPLCKVPYTRQMAFELLTGLCRVMPEQLSHVLNETLDIVRSSSVDRSSFRHAAARGRRSQTGYVGLRNLGCICYMHAMLQQLFMNPHFRFAILSADVHDRIEAEAKLIAAEDDPAQEQPADYEPVDRQLHENRLVVHELQKMFSYLSLSLRRDYNPTTWCEHFKDYSGNPVNVRIQQDTEEFVSAFLDKVTSGLRGTSQQQLIHQILTGSTIDQLINLSDKSKFRENEQVFHHLPITVRGVKDITESLGLMIKGEVISGYRWEDESSDAPAESVDIVKRPLIGRPPATFIVHAKRIDFDFETFQNEKINSRLEFPQVLDIWPYSRDGVMQREAEEAAEAAGVAPAAAPTGVSPSDYTYCLMGVVCHSGTAASGHYYSFIRDRASGEWFEFNDETVQPFDAAARLETETFGGSTGGTDSWGNAGSSKDDRSRNAYMLVYQKQNLEELAPAVAMAGAVHPNRPAVAGQLLADAERVLAERARDASDGPQNAVAEASEGVLQYGRQLVSKLKSVRDTHGLLQGIVPAHLYQEVFEDNLRFIRDQLVYSPEFYSFILRLLQTANATITAEATSPELRAQLEGQVLELAVDVVIGLIMHAADNAVLTEIVKELLLMIDRSPVTAQKLLEHFVSDPSVLVKYLVSCTVERVRQATADIVAKALECLSRGATPEEYAEQVTLSDEAASKRAAQLLEALGSTSSSDPVYILTMCGSASNRGAEDNQIAKHPLPATVDLLCAMCPLARKNASTVGQYFSLFAQIASIGSQEATLMRERGMLAGLVDLFMNDESPFIPEGSPKRTKWSTFAQARFSPLVAAVAKLAEGTQLPRDTSYFPYISDRVVLSEMDGVALGKARFLLEAIKNDMCTKEVAALAADLSLGNIGQLVWILSGVINEMTTAPVEKITRFWEVIYAMLRVSHPEDRYSKTRVDIVLGDPHINSHLSGVVRGLEPLPRQPEAPPLPAMLTEIADQTAGATVQEANADGAVVDVKSVEATDSVPMDVDAEEETKEADEDESMGKGTEKEGSALAESDAEVAARLAAEEAETARRAEVQRVYDEAMQVYISDLAAWKQQLNRRQQTAPGVGQGLLWEMFRRSWTHERQVCIHIRRLLTIVNELDCVAEYLMKLPPMCPQHATFIDWMTDVALRHCQSVFYGAVATPARKSVARSTVEELMALQSRAESVQRPGMSFASPELEEQWAAVPRHSLAMRYAAATGHVLYNQFHGKVRFYLYLLINPETPEVRLQAKVRVR